MVRKTSSQRVTTTPQRVRYIMPCSTCTSECSVVMAMPPTGLVCQRCRASPNTTTSVSPPPSPAGSPLPSALATSPTSFASSETESTSSEEEGGSGVNVGKSTRSKMHAAKRHKKRNNERRVKAGCNNKDLPKAKTIGTQYELKRAILHTKTREFYPAPSCSS